MGDLRTGGAPRSAESCAAHPKTEWPAHDSTDAPRLWESGKSGKAWKEKIEIVAEGEGRKRALVVETETIPKTEWPAHGSTDGHRLVESRKPDETRRQKLENRMQKVKARWDRRERQDSDLKSLTVGGLGDSAGGFFDELLQPSPFTVASCQRRIDCRHELLCRFRSPVQAVFRSAPGGRFRPVAPPQSSWSAHQ